MQIEQTALAGVVNVTPKLIGDDRGWFPETRSAAMTAAGLNLGFVQYKCTDVYAPDCDGGVRWDDPEIGIDWGLSGPAVLSAKDAVAPLLRDVASPFEWAQA